MARRVRPEVEAKHVTARLRFLKGKSLVIAEYDGALWWSEHHIAAPIDKVMEKLLDEFNLRIEPMVCNVGRSIHKTSVAHSHQGTSMQQLLAKAEKSTIQYELTQQTLNGSPIYTEAYGTEIEFWSSGGGPATCLDRRLRTEFFNALSEQPTLGTCADANYVIATRPSDKKFCGLIMPLRTVEA